MSDGEPIPTAESVRATFDATTPHTVGLEEEVLLVDPVTWLPAPEADAVARLADDPGIKTELPACQVEIMTAPHRRVDAAVEELANGRAALLAACRGQVRPVAAAVHPFDHSQNSIGTSRRASALLAEYGQIARRQLVGALQVHVALGDADVALTVHNALRSFLPELAALASAAPFHDGRDTGLASVRPVIAGQLPRQGIPPMIASWDRFVDDLQWGRASGSVREPRRWWWELRPHVHHGTLEVRVPDVQPTIGAAGAVASVVHALVVHLAHRHLDGETLTIAPTWRIAENRWSALRDGVHGCLADLDTGRPVPTGRRLHQIIDDIEPWAVGGLDAARSLVDRNASDQLRAVGIHDAVPWLADAFRG